MAAKRVHAFLFDVVVFFVALGLLGAGSLLVWVATMDMPDLDSFEARRVSQSTKIYDRTGEVLLYDVHNETRRTVVPFEDISRHVKNATIAIEDAEFYNHWGIRPLSFIRAVFANLQTGSFGQGGSTITQQVVKNALLTTEKSIPRKLKEWILAVKLERTISKDEILSHYLNETPYGGNLYGIEEAARAFFGKRAAEVTLPEASYLAALPQAPTYYSPYGNHLDALEERRQLVLTQMLANGFITAEEYAEAASSTVSFLPQDEYGIKAPHFVLYVKELLENRYGKQAVEDGGLKVITTLDYELQAAAEEMVKRYALENKKNFNAENAALVALDPNTGDILAMAGSRDYFDKEIDGNFNVALSPRQPGSSFKPFVYATAFKKGYLPETTVFDVKTEFSARCNPDGTPIIAGQEDQCYMPENYDHVYRGPVSFRNALAQSINVPAIKALYLAGLQDSIETARDLGITSLVDDGRYGLTLVLGGGEVSLLEMTSAYGTFAAGGVRNRYRSILSVADGSGLVTDLAQNAPQRVLDENIALQISDILSDNVARAPAFGENSYLYIPDAAVAVKTGTTNDYRDAWIVGYSPNVVVGAWAGNNDNSSMEKKVAGFIIAPLWNEFMKVALQKVPAASFKKPAPVDLAAVKPQLRGVWQGNERYVVDKISGKLATEYTPTELREERFVQNIHNILHWVDRKNPAGPPPTNPANDPQYNLWEYGVILWAAEHGLFSGASATPPTQYDSIHHPALAPTISLTGLVANAQIPQNQKVAVVVTGSGSFPLAQADFFINGRFVSSDMSTPFSLSFTPRYVEGIQSVNTFSVMVYDSVRNRSELSVPFLVPLD